MTSELLAICERHRQMHIKAVGTFVTPSGPMRLCGGCAAGLRAATDRAGLDLDASVVVRHRTDLGDLLRDARGAVIVVAVVASMFVCFYVAGAERAGLVLSVVWLVAFVAVGRLAQARRMRRVDAVLAGVRAQERRSSHTGRSIKQEEKVGA